MQSSDALQALLTDVGHALIMGPLMVLTVILAVSALRAVIRH